MTTQKDWPASATDVSTEQTYRPQIDGLRAIAMIGVLFVHFWDDKPVIEYVRVTLFFVVSGFLITHILIAARESGKRLQIGNFYVRRALRLFPALWLALTVAWVFDADNIRDNFLWHVLPTSNIYFAFNEKFEPWVLAHIWSLNLLEQFYLFWPVVVLLLPRSGVLIVAVLVYAALVFVQANIVPLGITSWWGDLVLSGDPIYVGALTCVLMREAGPRRVLASLWMLPPAMIVILSPLLLWDGFGHSQSYRIVSAFAVALVVAGAYQGYPGPLGRLLESGAARFVSKISYGVYVYHLLLWYIVGQVFPDLFAKDATTFAVMSGVTVAVAILSWYAIEAPVNRLRRHFPTATAAADQAR